MKDVLHTSTVPFLQTLRSQKHVFFSVLWNWPTQVNICWPIYILLKSRHLQRLFNALSPIYLSLKLDEIHSFESRYALLTFLTRIYIFSKKFQVFRDIISTSYRKNTLKVVILVIHQPSVWKEAKHFIRAKRKYQDE